jgi:hypothetical protein
MMADTVTVIAKVAFNAWQVPRFATISQPPRPRQEGMQVAQSVPVKDLKPEVLDALAQAWINHLYAGVGRKPPVLLP